MKSKIFNISLMSLFALLFTVPFYYYWLKVPFFSVIIIGIFLKLWKSRQNSWIYISKGFPIVQLTSWYVFLGSSFMLWGSQRAPENYLFFIGALYVIYPIIWGFVAYGLEKEHLILIYKTLIISTIFISIYVISYYLSLAGLSNWRLVLYIAELDIAKNANVTDGIASVNLVSISTLVFSVPFLLSLISLPKPPKLPWNDRKIYFCIILLSILAVVISGRRAAAISMLLTIPVSFLLSLFLPAQERPNLATRNVLLISVLIVSFLLMSPVVFANLQINTNSYIKYIVNAVTETEWIRVYQTEALINGWYKSPLIGLGHGVAADVIRDSTKPWRYEMSYYSLLFHTGILGFVGYSIGFLVIYLKGIYIIRRGGDNATLMIAQLTGLASMLIVYSTNPYFDALDILWTIFLPVAFINTSFAVQSHVKTPLFRFRLNHI